MNLNDKNKIIKNWKPNNRFDFTYLYEKLFKLWFYGIIIVQIK
jgi:hypothetical protein